MVTASDDKTARVWDARTGKPLTEPLTHKSDVRAAAFSPDGARVGTPQDRCSCTWSSRAPARRLDELAAHREAAWTSSLRAP